MTYMPSKDRANTQNGHRGRNGSPVTVQHRPVMVPEPAPCPTILDSATVPAKIPTPSRGTLPHFSHLYTALERELDADVQVVEQAITRTQSTYVLGITSAVAGEGKTTVALQLAVSVARDTGRRVALVDLSLGKDDIRVRLGIPDGATGGVVEVLEDTQGTLTPFLPEDFENLLIMPAGRAPANPARAARSPRAAEVIERARQLCDIVVLDLPAISTGNVGPLARYVEGLAVVVRSGATPRHIVARALDQVGRERVLGVVLNRVKSPVPRWLARRILWS